MATSVATNHSQSNGKNGGHERKSSSSAREEDPETSKANFSLGADNSPEMAHEFRFSMAHANKMRQYGQEAFDDGLRDFGTDFIDDDDDPLVDWDHPGGAVCPIDQDNLSNLIAIQRVDSRDVVFDNKPKKTKILGKYVMGDLLGEGSYAKVKEAIDQETLCRRAIKIMKRKRLKKIPHGETNVQREIELVRNLKHKNVMALIEVFYNDEKGKIYMVLEYCCTVLKDMLDQSPVKKFPAWQAHFYFNQLTCGLEYLHSNCVIHKDIKPGNLLLDTAGVLKIADFGVAEKLDLFAKDDTITTSQGTPAFQPPEIAQGASEFSGLKLDIWSCGITLYNFVTGSYPFEGETIFRLFENIAACEFEVPRSDVDPLLETLIRGMLNADPVERYNVVQVRTHDWCRKNHPCNAPPVTITPQGDDPTLTTTVLPYLIDHHMGDREGIANSNQEYITEHDLHEHQRLLREEAVDIATAALHHGASGHEGGAGATLGASSTSGMASSRKGSKTTKCIKVKKMAHCSVS